MHFKAYKQLKYMSSSLPISGNDNSIAITDEDKPELFRQHLSEIFKPHPDTFNPDITAKITQYLNPPVNLYRPEKSITPFVSHSINVFF